MSTPLEKIYIYFCLTLTRTVNYSLNALTVSFGSLRNMTGVFFINSYFSYTNSDTIEKVIVPKMSTPWYIIN